MTAKSVTIKAKTVDDAIKEGLNELGLSLGEVDIEILSDSKGFLGLNKSAQVKLTKKSGPENLAEEFLTGLFEHMNVNATMSINVTEESLNVDLTGDQTGVLVGRRGETLDAIQYLTSLVVNRSQEEFKRVIVDTENYREKREQTLVKLAERIASKVIKTGKRVVLEPMNPYERRVLHATLQNNPKVETLSEGDEPYRKVVVRKKRAPRN